MVYLSRIYTKTGDEGSTSIGDNSKISKSDTRIEAIGAVDEVNSYIGVTLNYVMDSKIKSVLLKIQNDLFDLGADLCMTCTENSTKESLRINDEYVKFLENEIDDFNSELSELNSFIIPSGSVVSSHLHFLRTIVRNAERRIWRAIDEYGNSINRLTAVYLNRLSDLFFVLARFENKSGTEKLWIPKVKNS
jgi:cob(I)alamin adenosyltransferase